MTWQSNLLSLRRNMRQVRNSDFSVLVLLVCWFIVLNLLRLTFVLRTSHWMSWEMNFPNDNPDILTACVMKSKILALIMFAETHRGYCSVSPWIMLDFLDSRAHSLSTTTNTPTLMGGCLTLCASYSAVQWVRAIEWGSYLNLFHLMSSHLQKDISAHRADEEICLLHNSLVMTESPNSPDAGSGSIY